MLKNFQTHKAMPSTNLWTGDKRSYQMLPDNTVIKCQLIDNAGNNVKADGTPGTQIVTARICDQRIFYSDILYWVKGIDSEFENSTLASLIVHPVVDGAVPE